MSSLKIINTVKLRLPTRLDYKHVLDFIDAVRFSNPGGLVVMW